MATATETKISDAARKTAGETAQASAAYARMLADESATRVRASTEMGAEKMNRFADGMLKAAEEATAFGRGNVEALAKAAQAYASGVQDLSRQAVAMVQGLTEQTLESAKALSGARSLKEAAEIQAGLVRTSFERAVSDATKLQETALKVVEQSFAPLSARMTFAAEKMGRPIAA